MFVFCTHRQTQDEVITGSDAAWAFLGGVFAVVIPDNLAPVVERADALFPRFNDAFREYAQHCGFARSIRPGCGTRRTSPVSSAACSTCAGTSSSANSSSIWPTAGSDATCAGGIGLHWQPPSGVLPLSTGHLLETAGLHGDRRHEIGVAMAHLAGGWQIRNPLDLWKHEENAPVLHPIVTEPGALFGSDASFGITDETRTWTSSWRC